MTIPRIESPTDAGPSMLACDPADSNPRSFAQPALVIVMPAFNEEASVRKVVIEWFAEVEGWEENFLFLAIDDGSNDRTLAILHGLRERLGERLVVRSQANSGHGQSCLFGYREALRMGADWILQIDSDGQCSSEYFFRFWRLREKADVIYGLRNRRDDGIRRVLASIVLRAFLLVLFHVWCPDSNVPYRLINRRWLAKYVDQIPADFSLANVALATLLAADKCCRHRYVPIRFRERYGGEPSVKISLFGLKALELYRQMRSMLASAKTM